MDKLTIPPDADGYSFVDGLEVLRAVLEGGAGRYRTNRINSMVPLNVQWTVGPADYEYLRDAYHTHVDEGHAPFAIDLIVDEATLREYFVRIKPGSFKLSSVRGLVFTVQATLEVPLQPWTPFVGSLPKLTLAPDFDGYGFADTPEAEFTELDGGPSRVIRTQIGVTTLIDVQWKTNPAGFLYLRNFYRNWTTNPREGFLMDLILDQAEPTELRANFVPGTMQLSSTMGNLFVVKARLEVIDGVWPIGEGSTGETPIWLDTFTGAANTLLYLHAQDIPWNGSVWADTDDAFNKMQVLSGTGHAVTQAYTDGLGNQNGSSYARTTFTEDSNGLALQYGYRFEVDFANIPYQEGGEASIVSELILTFANGSGATIQFGAPTFDAPEEPGFMSIYFFGDAESTSYDWPSGEHTLTIQVFENHFRVLIDNVEIDDHYPVGFDSQPMALPNGWIEWQQSTTFYREEDDFSNWISPSSYFNRSAIYGTLASDHWLFFNQDDALQPFNQTVTGPPVPFAVGTGCSSDNGLGENTANVPGNDLRIPLYSEVYFGNWFWENADPESPITYGIRTVSYADDHPLAEANREVYPSNPELPFPTPWADWTGGTLTMYSMDGIHATVLTFLPSTSYYPPVSIEYVEL